MTKGKADKIIVPGHSIGASGRAVAGSEPLSALPCLDPCGAPLRFGGRSLPTSTMLLGSRHFFREAARAVDPPSKIILGWCAMNLKQQTALDFLLAKLTDVRGFTNIQYTAKLDASGTVVLTLALSGFPIISIGRQGGYGMPDIRSYPENGRPSCLAYPGNAAFDACLFGDKHLLRQSTQPRTKHKAIISAPSTHSPVEGSSSDMHRDGSTEKRHELVIKDYKAIFDCIESTFFEIGSKKLPRAQIEAELEQYKHLEGRRFSDSEYYRMLVHITFYSGFTAQTVSNKIGVIDQHFPNYQVVADYAEREVKTILQDENMIKHSGKVRACVSNAKEFRSLIEKHGSIQNYVDSFSPTQNDSNLLRLKEELQRRFAWISDTTSLHFLTDIGMPVLKPDRVVRRLFARLGLADEDASSMVIVDEGRKFARATGHPIRYIDIILVAYGQVQAKELGLDRGVCVDNPSCSICGVRQHCDYWARSRRAATA